MESRRLSNRSAGQHSPAASARRPASLTTGGSASPRCGLRSERDRRCTSGDTRERASRRRRAARHSIAAAGDQVSGPSPRERKRPLAHSAMFRTIETLARSSAGRECAGSRRPEQIEAASNWNSTATRYASEALAVGDGTRSARTGTGTRSEIADERERERRSNRDGRERKRGGIGNVERLAIENLLVRDRLAAGLHARGRQQAGPMEDSTGRSSEPCTCRDGSTVREDPRGTASAFPFPFVDGPQLVPVRSRPAARSRLSDEPRRRSASASRAVPSQRRTCKRSRPRPRAVTCSWHRATSRSRPKPY